MSNILVTGGLGYIGSHTVVELLSAGYDVHIVDDLSNSERFILDRIEEVSGKRPKFSHFDLKETEATKNLLTHHDFEGIVHFAAKKSVAESVRNPLLYYQNNLMSLLNLFAAIENSPVKSFIQSSSCTVYGQADEMPISEDAIQKTASSPYGKTKQMAEAMLMDFCNVYKTNTISLRYFNPIGAHPSAKLGELSKGTPDNLVPYITQSVAKKRDKLTIFGNDYATPDGTAVRDYIYVGDLAKAHVLALKKSIENSSPGYEAYNLGSGIGHSVLELVSCFERANQIKVPYEFGPRRHGDIAIAYANPEKARKELGWNASTSLTESLKTAWNWEKSCV